LHETSELAEAGKKQSDTSVAAVNSNDNVSVPTRPPNLRGSFCAPRPNVMVLFVTRFIIIIIITAVEFFSSSYDHKIPPLERIVS
jgi:hypothetical protein